MTEPVFLTIRLPLKIGPMERYEFWEEPLTDVLESDDLGEISGGGTMMAEEGSIQYSDIELELPDLADDRLAKIEAAMLKLGAPKKTLMLADDATTLKEFGIISVVGIGLDGTGLPDSAYEDFDPDTFSDDIVATLGDGYTYGGSDAGERYTFFYYHGADGAYIEDTLKIIAARLPIGQGAQFVHLA